MLKGQLVLLHDLFPPGGKIRLGRRKSHYHKCSRKRGGSSGKAFSVMKFWGANNHRLKRGPENEETGADESAPTNRIQGDMDFRRGPPEKTEQKLQCPTKVKRKN